jgi:hypothetical protein
MRELPPAKGDRVLKLVRMLSSPNANEAGVAAAALNRALADAGLSIHDLAGAVEWGFKSAPVAPRREKKPPQDNWRAVVESCISRRLYRSPREEEFLKGLGDWRGQLTERQAAWLQAIAAGGEWP